MRRDGFIVDFKATVPKNTAIYLVFIDNYRAITVRTGHFKEVISHLYRCRNIIGLSV